jgi:predicted O-linked N-acetylglucosamine transferase (SPINDLY family)
VYNLSGNPQAARAALHRALNTQPDHPAALNSLGNLLMSSGDFHAAAGLFSKALQLTPDNPKLHFNLGTALKELSALESAQDSFETALRLDPGMDKAFAEYFRIRQHLCDWSTYPEDLEKLLHLNQQCLAAGKQSPIYPFDALSLPVTAAEQRQIAASCASEFSARVTPFRSGFVHRDTSQTRRLRIGYVSANFNNHAESHLTASMFGLHDRNRYEVFAYSTGKNDGSKYRQRIQDGCEPLSMCSMIPTSVANRIFADGIQILVIRSS